MGGCDSEVMLGSGTSLGTGYFVVVLPQDLAWQGRRWGDTTDAVVIINGSGDCALSSKGSAPPHASLGMAWTLLTPPQPQVGSPGGTACKGAGAALCPS